MKPYQYFVYLYRCSTLFVFYPCKTHNNPKIIAEGNTDIKIVAVITTDGGEPVQILLSQMKLQDRSLESIFNSAGQDILEQLSEKANGTNEDDTQSQESEE